MAHWATMAFGSLTVSGQAIEFGVWAKDSGAKRFWVPHPLWFSRVRVLTPPFSRLSLLAFRLFG
jgi:hypothetical protein